VAKDLQHEAVEGRAPTRAPIRAAHTCGRCGSDRNLVAHHIIALKDGGAPYDPDNLEVVCRSCHRTRRERGSFFGDSEPDHSELNELIRELPVERAISIVDNELAFAALDKQLDRLLERLGNHGVEGDAAS